MNSDVFNKKGDFITSPEISQMFGEILGIWHVMFFEKKKMLGEKKCLVEMGPGTGKLQIVILNVFLQMGVLKNLEVHMIEVSPFLRDLQQREINLFFLRKGFVLERFEKHGREVFFCKKLGFKIVWHKEVIKGLEVVDKIDCPVNFICHEFFDALPALKFRFFNGYWHEELIDVENLKNMNAENFEHTKEKTFKTTLSLPNSNSVKNILKPEIRFRNYENSNNPKKENPNNPKNENTQNKTETEKNPKNPKNLPKTLPPKIPTKIEISPICTLKSSTLHRHPLKHNLKKVRLSPNNRLRLTPPLRRLPNRHKKPQIHTKRPNPRISRIDRFELFRRFYEFGGNC